MFFPEPGDYVRRYELLLEAELDMEIGNNICFVVQNGLCHGCGTCVAVCPKDAIIMTYREDAGVHLPKIEKRKCDECRLCVRVCSGFELDLEMRADEVGRISRHPLIGPYVEIYRAYSLNRTRRSRGASGGMVTEVADYLISASAVDGAIVTRMQYDKPLQAQGYLALSSNDLVASQKSKYCPVPLNTILKDLIRGKEVRRFVYVGLPHHVHGLRLVQKIFPHMRDSVPYVISLFTAHVPSQRATEFVLYKNGISASNVRLIEYRGGGNPGRMRVILKDGTIKTVPHLHWTYYGHAFSNFFYPAREWLYFDKLSELADISFGDNWMRGLNEQAGASTVIARTQDANELLCALEASKRARLMRITATDLMNDQSLLRKLNIGARLKVWAWLGRKTPIYYRSFQVKLWQIVSSFRFALYVIIFESPPSPRIMSVIIRADYLLRAKPTKVVKKCIKIAKAAVVAILPCRRHRPAAIGRYKIVLIGGYGHKDIGDEAMPHAIRSALRSALGEELELVMLSVDSQSTAEQHGEKSLRDFTYLGYTPNASLARKGLTWVLTTVVIASVLIEKTGIRMRLWPAAREAIDEIATADAVLNVGGGNINSIITDELYKKCTTYLLANIMGKPVYLSGQTMGPFNTRFDRVYARLCLNTVRMITFRDKDVSRNRLLELGVDKPRMVDAADDAMMLHGIPTAQALRLVESEVGVSISELKRNMMVMLNMKASLSIFTNSSGSNSLDAENHLMAEIADSLIDAYGCNIIFVPTDYSYGVDDRGCHEKIISLMSSQRNVFLLDKEYTDDELIGIIGCADFALGARYHFNVFAALRSVPFIGIASGVYQRTKLEGLSNLCGLPECYINHDMGEVSIGDVWPQIARVISQRDDIRKTLCKRVLALKRTSEIVVGAVIDDLRMQ